MKHLNLWQFREIAGDHIQKAVCAEIRYQVITQVGFRVREQLRDQVRIPFYMTVGVLIGVNLEHLR